MALTDPDDTLAFHGSRVLTSYRDMSAVPCFAVASALELFMKHDKLKDAVPESEALWFYGLNHAVALISARRAPLEPLLQWETGVLRDYHAVLGPKAVRAFYYLLWICTREARHAHNLDDFANTLEKLGKGLKSFYQAINGGEPGISKKFVSEPPACSIGAYCKSLCEIFYKANFSGGYGGPAWGGIADVLSKFVHGEYSAEIMLDTVWTLCHNGGPIFNKGEFYGHYNQTDLIRLLDVQRSGQIPEAILFDDTLRGYADPGLINRIEFVHKQFKDKLGPCVDWLRVEALGAVKKYPTEIAEQHAAGNVSPEQKALLEKALKEKELAELAVKEAAEKAKAEKAMKYFTLMPGVEIPKVQRAA
jgi:hypothetical protein